MQCVQSPALQTLRLRHAHRHLATHGITTSIVGKATSSSETNPADTTSTMSSTRKTELKRSLGMWTAVDHIPFMQSESSYFQKFLSTLNNEVKQHMPSGDTVRAWTMELFEKKKGELTDHLEQSIRQMRYESCPHRATTQ
jgi:hypothetical protein